MLEVELATLLVEHQEARHDRPGLRCHQLLRACDLQQIGGGLVGEYGMSVLVDDGDRLRQVHEDRLEALLHLAHLRIQARVVDRQGRPPRELADEP